MRYTVDFITSARGAKPEQVVVQANLATALSMIVEDAKKRLPDVDFNITDLAFTHAEMTEGAFIFLNRQNKRILRYLLSEDDEVQTHLYQIP